MFRSLQVYTAPPQPASLLLQKLPDAELDLVLQQLDQRSLACAAVTCHKLRLAVPAAVSKVAVHSTIPHTFQSFSWWWQRHFTRLASLRQLSMAGISVHYIRPGSPDTRFLPGVCRQLRVLKVRDYELELERVLQVCSGLTALDLQSCGFTDAPAAAAAIAALPELQSLRLAENHELFEPTQLQLPSQLTHLSLECDRFRLQKNEYMQLGQLSGLVNLRHLQLRNLVDVPGGLPSQLVTLTCLDVHYLCGCDAAEQLQHLSCFTALQQLSVRGTAGPCRDWVADNVPGIQQLTQLTSMDLESDDLEFSSASTRSWAHLTALQSLTLRSCKVQPDALASLTQLRALSLHHVASIHQVQPHPASGPAVFVPVAAELLFAAVSQLPLLTLLQVASNLFPPTHTPPSPAAAGATCTALTASTKLASLQLSLRSDATDECVVFNAQTGALYPDLRVIDLLYKQHFFTVPLGEQQLELLCSCCPALDSLSFKVMPEPDTNPSPSAFQPLLQLSALTHLAVSAGSAAAATAVVDVAAQLTGLKQLRLRLPYVVGTWEVSSDTLMQLTALTALEVLKFEDHSVTIDDGYPRLYLQNKARWLDPPDVWSQLQARLSGATNPLASHDESSRPWQPPSPGWDAPQRIW